MVVKILYRWQNRGTIFLAFAVVDLEGVQEAPPKCTKQKKSGLLRERPYQKHILSECLQIQAADI